MCLNTSRPGTGGINGTVIKSTFDAKKSQTAAVYALNGGFQLNANAAFGRKWMYKSPAEMSVLITERE